MDTADTGIDTGYEIEEQTEVISAAELAGEEGGFSCSSVALNPSFVLAFIFAASLIIFRRA